MVTDADLYSKGYEPLHIRRTNIDQQLDTGIDGIFKNPETGEYIIVESKYNWSQLVNNTADGRQMSDAWLLGETTGFNRIIAEVGQELGDDIIETGYTRVLSKIQTDGSIIYKELDSFGYNPVNWTP